MQLPHECPAHSGVIAESDNTKRRCDEMEEAASEWRLRIEDKLDDLTAGLRMRLPWLAVALITGLFGLSCTLLTLLVETRAG